MASRRRELDLGGHLLSFLDMYGRKFNYCSVGISVRDGGYLFSKVYELFIVSVLSYSAY